MGGVGPISCPHGYDFENDPYYRATGIPPREITCLICCGEGFCGDGFIPEDWGAKTYRGEERAWRRYLKQFTPEGRCRRCNGSGLVENTEKIGTTYEKVRPMSDDELMSAKITLTGGKANMTIYDVYGHQRTPYAASR
jgi:hypothetical protein